MNVSESSFTIKYDLDTIKNELKIEQTKERFWSKVEKTDSCWNWTGSLRNGYGLFRFNGKIQSAHRVSFELIKGKIPKGLELDHLCRNPSCVNSDHLEPVTGKENNARSDSLPAKNARKTHCKYGHEFTPENTYIMNCGGRRCIICKNQYNKQYCQSHKEEIKLRNKQYYQTHGC